MIKLKNSLFMLLLALGSLLNIYYYWENIWSIWAKHYIKDQNIVISLTTTPHRINHIKLTLDCLSQQNIPIQQIYLNLPHVFKRENITYHIPDWLYSYPNLTILRTEDYGPATKILGTLKNAPIKDNTIIIAVDDDTCYPQNMALHLATRAKQYPNQAIGVSGGELDFTDGKASGVKKIISDHKVVSILEGFAGIAYRQTFFNEQIYEVSKEPAFCYNSDDLYLSFHLAQNGITRQTVTNKFIKLQNFRQLTYGYNDDALYKLGHSEAARYKLCFEYLHSKHPSVKFNGYLTIDEHVL